MNPLEPTEVRPPRAGSTGETASLSAETPGHNVDTTVAQATPGPLAPLYQPGDSIGRYQVRRLLGEGAFGRVYACWDDKLAREVAVKTPKRRLATDDQLAAFLREARAAGRLRHPGIVQVFDVNQQESGEPYVVMELVTGESLAELARREQLSPKRIAELLANAASALAHAHQNDIVHRDIKPSNIWIDQQGGVRLLDFGLALDDAQRWQHAGELAGTFYYMPPEQISRQAHRLDGRADIWSLGVILYELLTGRRPFSGSKLGELSDEIQNKDPRPPRQLNPAADPRLERICLKCLAKSPGERYATAADLAQDLRRAAAEPSQPVLLSPAFMIWVGVMILVMIPVGLGAIFMATGGLNPPQPAGPDIVAGPTALAWGVDVFLAGAQEKAIHVNEQPVELVNGDAVQIWAKLPEPRYLGVMWIGSDGQVGVLHPKTPADNRPLTEFRQPPERSKGFPVQGPGGVETAVLIVSPEPLPPTDKLAAALAPSAPFPSLGELVLLDGVDVQPKRLASDSEGQQLLARAGRRGIKTEAADLERNASVAQLEDWKAVAASELPAGAQLHYLAIPHAP